MSRKKSLIRIRLARSVIGIPSDQKATVRSLGLRRLGDVVEKPDSETIRGMVRKVLHVVEVEKVAER